MSLRHAQVQSSYQPLTVVFVAVVGLLLVGVGYATWSSTVITITPLIKPVETMLTLSVGPTAADDRLVGTVTSVTEKATVSATPSATGTPVPAHATGTVTLTNETGQNQPLAVRTRLQSAGGVIVRTNRRVDVPAGGSVAVEVTADPLGEEGNVAPGRLTIVALWPATQAKIYGQTTEPLHGGMVNAEGTLSLDALTEASNRAQAEIEQRLGPTATGVFRQLIPAGVVSVPKPDVASDTYQVTVTTTVLSVSYPTAELQSRVRAELMKSTPAGLTLMDADEPKLTLTDRPTSDTAVFSIRASGRSQAASDNSVLTAATYANLTIGEVHRRALDSSFVKSVSVRLSPRWRQRTPIQAERITINVAPAQVE